MKDVAIVAFAQSPLVRREADNDEPRMIMPVIRELYDQWSAAVGHRLHRLREC